MDWFLYDNGLRHERVKLFNHSEFTLKKNYALSCTVIGKSLIIPSLKTTPFIVNHSNNKSYIFIPPYIFNLLMNINI